MAKQESNHPFVGRIGDLIYYKRNGNYFVRKAGSPSKEKIKSAPEFEKTRKLNCEFGGCVKVGHDLREAIATLLPQLSDKDITGRLVGLFSKVIKNGDGECGTRMIQIVKNRELLKGFQFHKEVSFDGIFSEPIHFMASRNRKEIAIRINEFNPVLTLGKYIGVTHFRLFLASVAFSDFIYDEQVESYKALNESVHESFTIDYSNYISVADKCNELSIVSKLPIKDRLSKSIGIILIVGIEFFKEENGIMYSMPTKNCMKIGEVV